MNENVLMMIKVDRHQHTSGNIFKEACSHLLKETEELLYVKLLLAINQFEV